MEQNIEVCVCAVSDACVADGPSNTSVSWAQKYACARPVPRKRRPLRDANLRLDQG